MSLFDKKHRAFMRLAALTVMALPLAGCFTPVYGEKTRGGGAAQLEMAKVDVAPIGGRQGIIMRNEIIFGLAGGQGLPAAPAYQLIVTYTTTSTPTLVDVNGGRPVNVAIVLNGTYMLIEKPGGKVLTKGYAVGSASVDKSSQVYAGDRGQTDAGDRAAKVLAEQMVSQLASYFAARR